MTDATEITGALSRALEGRELLTHPFYQRWEAGELTTAELGAYAVQYRTFEAALPALLAGVVGRLRADGATEVADMVARNLADELGRPQPHLVLFDQFAAAVMADASGAVTTAEGPAATALVDTYRDLLCEGPVAALAGIAAYETQASAIAASKADGLRRWYGMDGDSVAFWDVHTQMDADHGEWVMDALALLGADPTVVSVAARRGADAWWALLDERQAEAPGVAA